MADDSSLSYTLVITGAPYSSQAPQTALAFARALRRAGHRIDRVFLYGEGVYLATALATPPSDETSWGLAWSEFLRQESIPAVACIASALRRGIVNEAEQKRHRLSGHNLETVFTLAGLGEWVEGLSHSSRVIYFHGGD